MINVPSTQVSVTPEVHNLMLQGINFGPFVAMHLRGDWGDINETERALNIESLEKDTGHVLSIHHVTPELIIWLTTKAGQTVIMLPMN
ncbi:TPA: hypothetical protein ML354_001716 [Salmonella enterica]|nr:hypothetical protein [Salmonella enterica subsp. enterica serovar Llandoff]ECG5099398.1 hypothetical protein [Salmonella enterica subsp. enterica]EEM8096005.1 hypothetical protein [Salmonella enterica]EJN2898452.1 hypothetical protein [Salmonella enterica subsp. enterica serovar Monschaui]EDR3007235.1 hypothetical protein [Salmonella enterica subsp. enterica]